MYMYCFVNRSFIHCYIQLKQRLSKESILYIPIGRGRKIPGVAPLHLVSVGGTASPLKKTVVENFASV